MSIHPSPAVQNSNRDVNQPLFFFFFTKVVNYRGCCIFYNSTPFLFISCPTYHIGSFFLFLQGNSLAEISPFLSPSFLCKDIYITVAVISKKLSILGFDEHFRKFLKLSCHVNYQRNCCIATEQFLTEKNSGPLYFRKISESPSSVMCFICWRPGLHTLSFSAVVTVHENALETMLCHTLV